MIDDERRMKDVGATPSSLSTTSTTILNRLPLSPLSCPVHITSVFLATLVSIRAIAVIPEERWMPDFVE